MILIRAEVRCDDCGTADAVTVNLEFLFLLAYSYAADDAQGYPSDSWLMNVPAG